MTKHTHSASDEVRSLVIIKLSSSHTGQTGRFIVHSAGSPLVFIEGVGGNKNDVNNTGSDGQNGLRAVRDRRIDTPGFEVVLMGLCNLNLSVVKNKWKGLLIRM